MINNNRLITRGSVQCQLLIRNQYIYRRVLSVCSIADSSNPLSRADRYIYGNTTQRDERKPISNPLALYPYTIAVDPFLLSCKQRKDRCVFIVKMLVIIIFQLLKLYLKYLGPTVELLLLFVY